VENEQFVILPRNAGACYYHFSCISYDGIINLKDFSVYEDDMTLLLNFIFEKYYDNELSKVFRNDKSIDIYSWHYNYNVYTYETIMKIIDEIKEYVKLLKYDYKNHKLKDIKQRNVLKGPNDKIVELIIMFYKHFCFMLEDLMQDNSGYNLISIIGQ